MGTVTQAGIMDYYSPPGGLQGYCTKPMTPNQKDPDGGKDRGQEEKAATEDEMVGWHHWLNGHESAQTQEDSEGQGNLACCSSWGPEKLDMTQQLNKTKHKLRATTWAISHGVDYLLCVKRRILSQVWRFFPCCSTYGAASWIKSRRQDIWDQVWAPMLSISSNKLLISSLPPYSFNHHKERTKFFQFIFL